MITTTTSRSKFIFKNSQLFPMAIGLLKTNCSLANFDEIFVIQFSQNVYIFQTNLSVFVTSL